MKTVIAVIIMRAVMHCLAGYRDEWARAMQAEFQTTVEDGQGLNFAFGCLIAALRDMPSHEVGRFAIANYVLVLGLIIPMGGMLICSVALGYAYLTPSGIGASAFLGTGVPTLLNEATQTGLPLIAASTLVLGLGHLWIAWAVLDRDWERVAATGRAGAAVVTTTVIFTGALFLYDPCALPQGLAALIELALLWILIRWQTAISEAGYSAAHMD